MAVSSSTVKVETKYTKIESKLECDSPEAFDQLQQDHEQAKMEVKLEIQNSKGFLYFLQTEDEPLAHQGRMATHLVYLVKKSVC